MFLDKVCMYCNYFYNEGATCKCGKCCDTLPEDNEDEGGDV